MKTVSCPICRRRTDAQFFVFSRNLTPQVAQALGEANPGWTLEKGACPRCVFRAVAHLQATGAPVEILHDPWGRQVPVYSRNNARVIPTPERVHANPFYAGRGVTMAFVDSGFYPHPDLLKPRRRILATVDLGSRQAVEHADFYEPRMESWHGMMTTCVAAGSGYQSGGLYRGIASEAQLVLVKVSRAQGGIGESQIARGLKWVLRNHVRLGIDIVNVSVGGNTHKSPRVDPHKLGELVGDLVRRGILVVVASGNSGLPSLSPPATASTALTVGGLDDQNQLDRTRRQMYNSNYGLGMRGERKPELIAPAIWVAAPVLPGTPTAEEVDYLYRLRAAKDTRAIRRLLRREFAKARFTADIAGMPLETIQKALWRRMVEGKFVHPYYQHVDGTSFAAPITSSVAAQLREAHVGLRPHDVKRILLDTAEPVPGVPVERQGRGVLSAGRALATALRAKGARLEGVPVSPHVTTEGVTFVVEDQGYRDVRLASDLLDWRPASLARNAGGYWHLTLPRPAPGSYVYKLVVDDTWSEDYENPLRFADGYGSFASILLVPA